MEVKFFDEDVKEFVNSLEKSDKKRVIRIIKLLQIPGYYVSMPFSKKIGHKLYELRIQGKLSIRIFYTYHDNKYVLLHGFIKKSMKIPLKELHTAINRLSQLA